MAGSEGFLGRHRMKGDAWERACTWGSVHARGLQSKGAPEDYEGSWSPRTAGRWGWSKVMPTPCVSVVSERTAEKIRGPSGSECQQPPAAGNRQGRGMAKVLVQKDHLRSGNCSGSGQ